jgi:NAD-dependent dihydropyrimidine dehydrogenase PreA subunit
MHVPWDCIHPKKDEAGFEEATMLYIHPEECIDCGACHTSRSRPYCKKQRQ